MRAILSMILVGFVLAGCNQQQTQWTPQMMAAVRRAQGSLTNFTEALETAKSNRADLAFCQVCAPFPLKAGQSVGFAWVHVWEYDGSAFTGRVLTQDPSLSVTNMQLVTIPATNVIDWMYLGKTGLVGRFLDQARR